MTERSRPSGWTPALTAAVVSVLVLSGCAIAVVVYGASVPAAQPEGAG